MRKTIVVISALVCALLLFPARVFSEPQETSAGEETAAEPAVVNVISYNLEVACGTPLEELPLPKTLFAELSDGSTREIEVTWEYMDGYDPDVPGLYLFTSDFGSYPYGSIQPMILITVLPEEELPQAQTGVLGSPMPESTEPEPESQTPAAETNTAEKTSAAETPPETTAVQTTAAETTEAETTVPAEETEPVSEEAETPETYAEETSEQTVPSGSEAGEGTSEKNSPDPRVIAACGAAGAAAVLGIAAGIRHRGKRSAEKDAFDRWIDRQ